MRLADPIRMQCDAHHAALLGAFVVDGIEVVADLAGEAVCFLAAAVQDDVVDVDRIGHRDQPAGFHVQRERLVVVIQIGRVVIAAFGGEIERVQRVGDRRAEPAAQPTAGQPLMDVLALLHRRALFLAGEVPVVACVVDAVRHVFPAALFHRPEDSGKCWMHRHVQADGAADAQMRRSPRTAAIGRRGCRSRAASSRAHRDAANAAMDRGVRTNFGRYS